MYFDYALPSKSLSIAKRYFIITKTHASFPHAGRMIRTYSKSYFPEMLLEILLKTISYTTAEHFIGTTLSHRRNQYGDNVSASTM